MKHLIPHPHGARPATLRPSWDLEQGRSTGAGHVEQGGARSMMASNTDSSNDRSACWITLRLEDPTTEAGSDPSPMSRRSLKRATSGCQATDEAL